MVLPAYADNINKIDSGKDRKEITMRKRHGVFFVIMAFAMMGVSLAAQEEGTGGKVNVTLDFSTTALSVNNDGDVDSFTDTGFGDDNESTLSVSYEGKLFGGIASLGFATDPDLYVMGEPVTEGVSPLAIDELYVWIKPFGEHFKFTGGIFENWDGVADYTDDIDNFAIGVFYDGVEGDNGVYTEPTAVMSTPALVNGFLAEAAFGPITAQLHLAPNFSGKAAGVYLSDVFGRMGAPISDDNAGARFFRIGGRVIADIGVGTVSALVMATGFPVKPYNEMYAAMGSSLTWPGDSMNMTTFGGYVDLTAIENLGISLGYTGFINDNSDANAKAPVYSGIDLRATWTGIEGLSISTHNNVSFAKGEDWYFFREADSSFFTLYNAIGVTKELTEKFSVNGEIGNIFSKTDAKSPAGDVEIDYDNFWGQLKLITTVTENAEFTVGVRVDYVTQNDVDDSTVFSVPIGIKVSF
jgi:hypothetical protein